MWRPLDLADAIDTMGLAGMSSGDPIDPMGGVTGLGNTRDLLPTLSARNGCGQNLSSFVVHRPALAGGTLGRAYSEFSDSASLGRHFNAIGAL